jgi:hypothetical protein
MGNLLTDNGLYVQNSGYILYQGTDGSRHIQFSSDNWGLTWRSTDGTLYFSRWDGVTLWQCDPNGNTIIPGNSYAAAYPGPCDKRLKKDIKPFNAGLAELLKLKPASWRYNGSGGVNDDGRRHAGLHAQDLETVIPECVLVMPEKQTANGETVTYPDQLAADTAPILAAVINALHEISERLAALEAKHE